MSELLTLPELAKQEHISEEAARKRASRGWYDKVKIDGKTYYRKPGATEPEPEPEPEPIEEPRPDKEPFPGAWEIADAFKDFHTWQDVKNIGEYLNGDAEAVGRWFFEAAHFEMAALVVSDQIRENGFPKAASRTEEGIFNYLIDELLAWHHTFLVDAVKKWVELGKPRIAPAAVIEKMRAKK